MFSKKDEVVLNILQTKDYERFNPLGGNRSLNAKNLKRLKDAMSVSYLICPICVNKKWQIIDGQHRLEAARQLGFPVYYYMCREYGLKEVQKLNANQANWTAKDYLDSYCELGYEEYLKVRNFTRQFKGFGIANTLTVLSNNLHSDSHYKYLGKTESGKDLRVNTFNTGTYECGDYELGVKIAKDLYEIGKYIEFFKKRTFVLAFRKIYSNPNFKLTMFLSKVKKFPSKIYDCPNTDHFLTMIEDLYNYRNKNKVSLRY